MSTKDVTFTEDNEIRYGARKVGLILHYPDKERPWKAIIWSTHLVNFRWLNNRFATLNEAKEAARARILNGPAPGLQYDMPIKTSYDK